MAALRYAAKKLCGNAIAIPRQRALYSALASRAFKEEPRRLLPGLILGEMPPCSYRRFFSSAASDPPRICKHQLPCCNGFIANSKSLVNMDSVSLERQIKEKKGELLHPLLKSASSKECAQENKELLHMLSQTHK
ncbi:unnamed protein product [Urochloa humidicola]